MAIPSSYENEVLVSYAWGGESERMVDELEQAFAEHGIRIVRDKKEIDYKGSIQEFEQRIGRGQCIVLVISDKYLRSEHCMYELVEVDNNKRFRERIFPIVLAEAKIYKAIDRLNYVKYWQQEIEKLDLAIRGINSVSNLDGITDDLDKYTKIRASIGHLTDILRDMNVLTPETHQVSGFSTLIEAVKGAMGLGSPVGPVGPNSEPVHTAQPELQQLATYYHHLLTKKEFLSDFERKLSQSASNLGILIAARKKLEDLSKVLTQIAEEIGNLENTIPFPASGLERISQLTDIIYNLTDSAAGIVASEGNPVKELDQISRNLPLFKILLEQLSFALSKLDEAND